MRPKRTLTPGQKLERNRRRKERQVAEAFTYYNNWRTDFELKIRAKYIQSGFQPDGTSNHPPRATPTRPNPSRWAVVRRVLKLA